jgi:RimJ/RimL family protein N-acetyltransferase
MNAENATPLAGEGGDVELCRLRDADAPDVLTFARRLDPHELLFLRRDIRQPKVVAAWLREIDAGQYDTVLAWRDGAVVGCGTLVRDPLSWSAHVAEIRVVIAKEVRGQGLGTRLIHEIFRMAITSGAEKIFAQMTTDQLGAIAVFEALGFRPEAVLRQHVKDQSGVAYDMVVLSVIVSEVESRLEAYGVADGDPPA